MYLEGSDQHRGWFHSSLLQSCGTRDRAPFNSILSHGFVVDGKGLKMSKSAGNVVSPDDILKKYGADILRSWVASSDYSEDLRIDNTILAQHAETYRKIRNTFRFILGNLKDSFQQQDFKKMNIKDFDELEQHILNRLFEVNNAVQKNIKNYNFHKLYKDLLNFCTLDLSSFYFDIRKDVLYCDKINSKKRQDCIKVLNVILECLLKWFAPILVFTTEEIFNLVNTKEKSIHETNLPSIPKEWENTILGEKWKNLFKLKQEANIAIEEKRTDKEIGSSLEAEIEINTSSKNFKLMENLDLAEYFITSKAIKIENKKVGAQTVIKVKKSTGKKCERCWKILDDKCLRCETAIKEVT
jgi:isoleucyl-tRNA synthetase